MTVCHVCYWNIIDYTYVYLLNVINANVFLFSGLLSPQSTADSSGLHRFADKLLYSLSALEKGSDDSISSTGECCYFSRFVLKDHFFNNSLTCFSSQHNYDQFLVKWSFQSIACTLYSVQALLFWTLCSIAI